MKLESRLFLGGAVFIPIGLIYGFMTRFTEWVGFPAFLLLGGMTMMVGFYLAKHSRVVGTRPEDNIEGEIIEKSGIVGTFAPWSWWPLFLGSAVAISFVGLAVGWWILFIGAGFALLGVIGWVFEQSRGDWAH